jgi:hypothetical protein
MLSMGLHGGQPSGVREETNYAEGSAILPPDPSAGSSSKPLARAENHALEGLLKMRLGFADHAYQLGRLVPRSSKGAYASRV